MSECKWTDFTCQLQQPEKCNKHLDQLGSEIPAGSEWSLSRWLAGINCSVGGGNQRLRSVRWLWFTSAEHVCELKSVLFSFYICVPHHLPWSYVHVVFIPLASDVTLTMGSYFWLRSLRSKFSLYCFQYFVGVFRAGWNIQEWED